MGGERPLGAADRAAGRNLNLAAPPGLAIFSRSFSARARGAVRHLAARAGSQAQDSAARGRDVEGEIMVSLEEALHGSVRSVSLRRTVACETCGGSGEKGRKPCPTCAGAGQVLKTETYQVKIPAGVTQGQRLRVPGRGEAGTHGGGSG